MNIVIRNLHETNRKNTTEKVNKLLKDGLRLSVEKAERKQPLKDAENGVIIAKCSNENDKSLIMKSKASLKTSMVCNNVFIESDKTNSETQCGKQN